jgi:hypothetical protein
MFKKTALVASIGLALSVTAQADYQWELGTDYATGDIEIGSFDADLDVFSVYGTYFLDTVDTSKGPLAEAAFLDRASSVQVDYSNGEFDGIFGDVDVEGYGIEGRYVFDQSGWLVDFGYRQDEFDNDDIETFSIGAGKYIAENTALVVSYANTEDDFDVDSDAYGVNLEHLWSLEQGAIKLDAGYTFVDPDQGDEVNVFSVDGTYYVNNSLGFGVSYALADSDDTDLEDWSLYSEWFINEQVAVSLAYTESEDDKTGVESDAIVISARVRF